MLFQRFLSFIPKLAESGLEQLSLYTLLELLVLDTPLTDSDTPKLQAISIGTQPFSKWCIDPLVISREPQGQQTCQVPFEKLVKHLDQTVSAQIKWPDGYSALHMAAQFGEELMCAVVTLFAFLLGVGRDGHQPLQPCKWDEGNHDSN